MGLLTDWLTRGTFEQSGYLVERTESAEVTALSDLIEELTASRSALSMEEALRLPSVVRGVGLLTSTAAQFLPVAYRNGSPVPEQPRIVTKPSPFMPRQNFISETMFSLVTNGNAYWFVSERDTNNQPKSMLIIPPSEMTIDWDSKRLQPVYKWRNTTMVPGQNFKHIWINRRPGELTGHSPLNDALPYLATIKSAEDYSLSVFTSGGLPAVVLKALEAISADEAASLKTKWMQSRQLAEPAILSKGFEVSFPDINPQLVQMQEARQYGATVTATVLGIPASLLHVTTSGSTITYVNAEGAIDELVKTTIQPMYLAPIESVWSELVPSTQSVRFDLSEMARTNVTGRLTNYKTAIEIGMMSAEEARAAEGWSPERIDSALAFDAVPSEV
jgi:HK97 family phage portal protein